MNEPPALLLLIANIEVIFAWIGATGFVIVYWRAPWKRSLMGRTLMQLGLTMWFLLTYALTARWIQPIDWLNYSLALFAYALVALSMIRLFVVFWLAVRGVITFDQPNWTPVRNWIRRRRVKTETVH